MTADLLALRPTTDGSSASAATEMLRRRQGSEEP
jgi:hypothetical protein